MRVQVPPPAPPTRPHEDAPPRALTGGTGRFGSGAARCYDARRWRRSSRSPLPSPRPAAPSTRGAGPTAPPATSAPCCGRDPLRPGHQPQRGRQGGADASQILAVDAAGPRIEGDGKPSDETVVHLAVVRERAAGAVLHTHSVWNTLLSEAAGDDGGLAIEGFEMLKGLDGRDHPRARRVGAHHPEHPGLRRACPRDVVAALRKNPACHGLLLRGHGLYTWGRDLARGPAARRDLRVPFRGRGTALRGDAAGSRPRARAAATGGSHGRG